MNATITGPATFDRAPQTLVQPEVTPVSVLPRSCAADQTTTCTKPTAENDAHKSVITAGIVVARDAPISAAALMINPAIATGVRAQYTEPVSFRRRSLTLPAANTEMKTAIHGSDAYIPIELSDNPRASVK